jgi:hypothetical protein
MAQPHQTVQASASTAQPSRPPAHIQAPAATAKSSYRLTTTLTPQSIVLLSYSHPQQPKGGSTTPLARLQTPLDCPPPTRSQQIGGPAELWALLPTTQAPDPPLARSDGWMAPSPRSFGASMPSHSPHQLMPFASMGGEWHSPHHFVPFKKHGGGMYSIGWLSAAADRGDSTQLPRDDGALACYHRGGKAITKLALSFLANSIISLPPTNNGGDCRLGGKSCLGPTAPAFGIQFLPGIC